MTKRPLRNLSSGKVTIFKIKNRSGYAAVCMNNLTEGKTPAIAYGRLNHPLKRMGFALKGSVPRERR